jgi:Tfp pilus assembly protein FimT
VSARTGWSQRSVDDRGITLVELLVTAAITAVLGVVAATVTVSTWKTQQVRSVSSDRSAAAKAATELLSRDLRDARSIVINRTGVGADTPGSVTVWDDRNFDYRAQASEKFTWTVDASGRLCRTTAVPTTRCVTASATTITFQNAAAPTGGNRAVAVSLTAGPDSPPRTWSVALENLR